MDDSAPDTPAARATTSRIANRFLRQYFDDQDADRLRTLAQYQALFPGHESLIARSFAALAGDAPEREGAANWLGADDELGPYRIVREIGHGGQSAVYLAEDTRADRRVALKVLHPGFGSSGEASVKRLRREAEAAAQIQHPGICPIYEVDVTGPSPYLAMPYFEGRTLMRWIEAAGPGGRDLRSILEVVAAIADALQAAHDAGIVHRDVKPDNVMILEDGRPLLLDLGVARTNESELTHTGALVGTLPYMAPEQLEGWRDIDGRVDVYALGVCLYECLTRKLPFDEPTQQRLSLAILNQPPPDPRRLRADVSTDLSVVVRTALAKDARHRYQSAGALADDLRRVLEHRTIHARPVTTAVRFGRWCRRNPALAGSTLGAFGLLALGLTASLVLLDRVREEESAKGVALDQKTEALEAKQVALDDLQRLADHKRLHDLELEEAVLWPMRAERADAMADWLERADALCARLHGHQKTLAALEATPLEGQRGGGDRGDPVTVRWHAEALADLIAKLEDFEDLTQRVHERERRARTIEAETIETYAGAWERARRAIALDDRFGSFELEPRIGLVPLGPDPQTDLQEFCFLESGAPPERDGSGALVLEPDMGLVFVLLPPGRFSMGALRPAAERPVGPANVDPYVREMASPVHEVELEPFLISKFEMTQGQWETLAGENPSYFKGEVLRQVSDRDPLLPIEHVSWEACRELFDQRGLDFPTEAQWEYAARGGTSTVWHTGDELESLIGFENLADEGSRHFRREGEPFLAGLDDGAVSTATVGSYWPNPYGLHDLVGNVMELCRDMFAHYGIPARPGDGLRETQDVPARCVRGGSFRDRGGEGSSAARHNGPPDAINPVVGVRPILPLAGSAETQGAED